MQKVAGKREVLGKGERKKGLRECNASKCESDREDWFLWWLSSSVKPELLVRNHTHRDTYMEERVTPLWISVA